MSVQKVCILTSVHQPEDVRIYQKQAKSLRRAGYEVYLVNPSVTKPMKWAFISSVRIFLPWVA